MPISDLTGLEKKIFVQNILYILQRIKLYSLQRMTYFYDKFKHIYIQAFFVERFRLQFMCNSRSWSPLNLHNKFMQVSYNIAAWIILEGRGSDPV